MGIGMIALVEAETADAVLAVLSEQGLGARVIGEVVGEDGAALTEFTPLGPHTFIWYYRELPDEARLPVEIQILHRDLGEENFEFALDGINVVSGEVVNGMRKGWKLEARQWKWVQVGVSS